MKQYAVTINDKVDAEFEGYRAAEQFWWHLSYLHQTMLVQLIRRTVVKSSVSPRENRAVNAQLAGIVEARVLATMPNLSPELVAQLVDKLVAVLETIYPQWVLYIEVVHKLVDQLLPIILPLVQKQTV